MIIAEWESVTVEYNSWSSTETFRLPVPGGWLYRVVVTSDDSETPDTTCATFVPEVAT